MKKHLQKSLIYLLIILPIAGFWYIFWKYALNIPHWDDFAVRNSVQKIIDEPVFFEKIGLLFAQHNEHRIFLTRFFASIIVFFNGKLDFKCLMFFGNLALIGILFVFYKILKKYNQSILAFVPLPFILMTISFYENSFWGMASVQNFWVIFLAISCFYYITFFETNPINSRLYLAVFLCFIGIFTSYNGITIPLIGALILLFQRRIKGFLLWIASAIIFLIAYFFSYQKPADISSKIEFSKLSLYLKGLITTMGSGIEAYQHTFNREELSMAIGLFLLIFIALFAYRVIFKKYNITNRNIDLFLLACIAFIVITCLGIAVSRSSFGIGTLLSSKYKIYSILLLMIFYVVTVISIKEKQQARFVILAIFASILFNYYTFFCDYDNLRFQHQERLTEKWNSENSEKTQIPSDFELKNPFLTNFKILDSKEMLKIDFDKSTALSFKNPENGFYVFLKSEKNAYIFPTKVFWQSKKNFFSADFILNESIKINGFRSEISKIGIKTDSYQIGILEIEHNKKSLTISSKSLDIQQVRFDNSKQNW